MKTQFVVAVLAFGCILAINARSLELSDKHPSNVAVNGNNIADNKDGLECIIEELQKLGDKDPEVADWVKRASEVYTELQVSLEKCNGNKFCEYRAQLKALRKFKDLQNELKEKPELAAAVRQAIETCTDTDDFGFIVKH